MVRQDLQFYSQKCCLSKIVSEYGQELPQSQTTDTKPVCFYAKMNVYDKEI